MKRKLIFKVISVFIIISVFFIAYKNYSHAAFSTVDCTNGAHLTTLGGISQAECQALEDLYTDTAGASWTTKTNWDTVSDVGTWYGVTRTGTHVTTILLNSNNLVGTLPSSISSLTGLVSFNVQNNTLSGPIPSFTSNTALINLIMSYNQFTGSIPSLSTNTLLEYVYFNNNQLTGSIPSLSTNTVLVDLYINNNQLTGSIPSLSTNTLLRYVDLGYNQLTGSIPSLTTNTTLVYFYVNNNQLTGSIPSLTPNTLLKYVELNNNQLTGSIPSLTANTVLEEFYVNKNNLSGDIPDLTSFASLLGSFAENALYTSSSTIDTAADTKFSENWSATQTIAPTGVAATVSGTDIIISWNPIEYASIGSYKVYSSTVSGGPYSTLQGTVARTGSQTLTISGLSTNTNYYFIVQSYTPDNGTQQNVVTADSAEVLGRIARRSSSSGSSGRVIHTYPTSADASKMNISLTNIPTLVNNIAKLKWSPIVNAVSMVFSLDSNFINAISMPFKQESNFILPSVIGTYNIYAKLTSSTGDSLYFNPILVKIDNISKIKLVEKPIVPKVINKKPTVTPIKTIKTCGPLNKYLEPGRVNNDKNEVKLWQNFLNKYEGEELDVNGNYDLLTQEAVFRYQAVNNMKVDGVIGSATRLPANRILGCK